MADVKIRFFARLRDQLGVSDMALLMSDVANTEEIIPHLLQTHPHWQKFFDAPLLMAVNQQLVNEPTELVAGDEVALFPPVTGG